MAEDRPFSAAAERNREPIRQVLAAWLPASGRLLEIGAGTGQHARYFAGSLPDWTWQPTNRPEELSQLEAGLAGVDLENLQRPQALDVNGDWPDGPWDAVYSANTAHIMDWPSVEAMFAGVGRSLVRDGLFFLYGPFMRAGRHHAASNAEFDAGLQSRGHGMGIRDLDALDRLADSNRLDRIAELAMPANNHTLIFQRSER
jgi:cyclopropane fatty-acyl-phospholipid synthase-like methyltransferase